MDLGDRESDSLTCSQAYERKPGARKGSAHSVARKKKVTSLSSRYGERPHRMRMSAFSSIAMILK